MQFPLFAVFFLLQRLVLKQNFDKQKKILAAIGATGAIIF
jgi:hypothetical protein